MSRRLSTFDYLFHLFNKIAYLKRFYDIILDIARTSSFNIIHLKSAFKIDIFSQKDDDFHKLIFTRRKKVKLDESIDHLFDIVSAEDVILLKLQWYQSADCTSERQWSDVLGVLTVQAGSLDMEHLRSCSEKLGINVLLEKAVKESQK